LEFCFGAISIDMILGLIWGDYDGVEVLNVVYVLVGLLVSLIRVIKL